MLADGSARLSNTQICPSYTPKPTWNGPQFIQDFTHPLRVLMGAQYSKLQPIYRAIEVAWNKVTRPSPGTHSVPPILCPKLALIVVVSPRILSRFGTRDSSVGQDAWIRGILSWVETKVRLFRASLAVRMVREERRKKSREERKRCRARGVTTRYKEKIKGIRWIYKNAPPFFLSFISVLSCLGIGTASLVRIRILNPNR